MGSSSYSGKTDVKYAQVALNIPAGKTFVYIIPPHLQAEVKLGSKVLVPFSSRQLQGYVVSIDDTCEFSAPKEILAVIGDDIWFDEEELSFYNWTADYYLYPLGKALAEIIPGSRGIKKTPSRETHATPPKTQTSVAAVMELNKHQKKAVREIFESVDSGRFCSFLLHGATGSGKTEVYLQLAQEALKKGGGVMYLVPEIGLTPQLLNLIRGFFPNGPVAVLHSRVTRNQRAKMWNLLRRGEVRFVLGARSALFAPVKDLRLVIVDEEHDESYKQDEKLCYHARDLALRRAQLANAVVVLGSATPSVESLYLARTGVHRYIFLPHREENLPLSRVELVDMRRERKGRGEEPLVISGYLLEAIRDVLGKGKQVLLLLNRRGFHTVKICRSCGEALRCSNCSLTLTFHAADGILKCHYCSFSMKDTLVCPYCNGGPVVSYGYGTEFVESIMHKQFPNSRVARMDRDTVTRRDICEKIVSSVAGGEIDIIIGTQMVAKGHEYPGIALVGVVSADTALNLPDFRASERTVQLLGQVIERVGRGKEPPRVIVQTFNPEHYTVKWLKYGDFSTFFEEEIVIRESLNFPPFSRLIQIWINCTKAEKGATEARRIGEEARRLSDFYGISQTVQIIGPTEAPIFKLRGRYRWHMLLKGRNFEDLHHLAKGLLAIKVRSDVRIKADVDPVNFL